MFVLVVNTPFIQWHQICASSTECRMIVFADCSKSLFSSLGNSCHRWLNCLFVRVLYWVIALHQVPCFHNHLAKTIVWGPFLWFQESTPNQNEYDARKHWWHITCTYFDMARYDLISYVSWVGKWHHPTFFLKLVSFSLSWHKNVLLEWRNIVMGNCPLFQLMCPSETVPLKTSPWIFRHPNFIKNTITLDASTGVNVMFVHRIL